MGRLLRYVLRPVLSLQKLSYDAAFMGRFAAIIPPPRRHLVRYYGALGPRSRLRRALAVGAKAQASCEELGVGFPVLGLRAAARGVARAARAAATKASRAWAACLRRVFEVDPVRCEGCGGEMELVAVITEDGELGRLLEHLGWPRGFPKNKPARAPPLPLGGEAEGCQLDGFEDDGRQSWPRGSGVDWPA